MGKDIARDIHCDVTMNNDVSMSTYDITLLDDDAMSTHDATMLHDVGQVYFFQSSKSIFGPIVSKMLLMSHPLMYIQISFHKNILLHKRRF